MKLVILVFVAALIGAVFGSDCQNPDYFDCFKSEICIYPNYVCDFDKDCTNGEDEVDCKNTPCRGGRFKCSDGKCIKSTHVCDGDSDCSDGGDEKIFGNPATIPAEKQKSQFFCPMTDGYGRLEAKADKSFKADILEDCTTSAHKSKIDWISYDSSSKTCRFYGKANIRSGVVKLASGPVKHYSTSACQLKGCGLSTEYEQCLEFFNGTSINYDPYYGFTCRKGPFGHGGTRSISVSGIKLRNDYGPLTRITVHIQTNYGMQLRTWYGPNQKEANEYGRYPNEQQHGNMASYDREKTREVQPAKDDCINSIDIIAENNDIFHIKDIFQLTFHTLKNQNFGPYFAYEKATAQYKAIHEERWKPTIVKAPEGTCLSYVDIWSADSVNGIAFMFEPLSEFPGVSN